MPSGPLGEVLGRLSGVEKRGDYYMAQCPAHDDSNPSLKVEAGDNVPVVVRCFSGCTQEQVRGALGYDSWDALMGESDEKPEVSRRAERATRRLTLDVRPKSKAELSLLEAERAKECLGPEERGLLQTLTPAAERIYPLPLGPTGTTPSSVCDCGRARYSPRARRHEAFRRRALGPPGEESFAPAPVRHASYRWRFTFVKSAHMRVRMRAPDRRAREQMREALIRRGLRRERVEEERAQQVDTEPMDHEKMNALF